MIRGSEQERVVGTPRVAQLAGQAVLSLAALDQVLSGAKSKLPVVSIHPSRHLLKGGLPDTWLGMGFTEPGHGLQPASDRLAARKVKSGVVVPLLGRTAQSIEYFTLPNSKVPHETAGGWWQTWDNIGMTHNAPGFHWGREHTYTRPIYFGRRLIETWFTKAAPYHDTPIAYDDPANPGQITATADITRSGLEQSQIAVGPIAVRQLLSGVREAAFATANEMPQAFDDALYYTARASGVQL